MQVLRARLYELEQKKRDDAVSQERRSQVGTGDRSEKIRTYNFPQSRLTDHRIGFSLYRLEDVMNGDLDPVFDALTQAEQAQKLTEPAADLALCAAVAFALDEPIYTVTTSGTGTTEPTTTVRMHAATCLLTSARRSTTMPR